VLSADAYKIEDNDTFPNESYLQALLEDFAGTYSGETTLHWPGVLILNYLEIRLPKSFTEPLKLAEHTWP
jgi:hypothetical protein